MLKSDAFAIFSLFLQFVKTQFNEIVKVIWTDSHWIFKESCSTLSNNLGITYIIDLAFIHLKQNGITKRKHRHILKVTRPVRLEANITLKFFGHCVKALSIWSTKHIT